jgi:sulfane dehydrogenase subunit SoxC
MRDKASFGQTGIRALRGLSRRQFVKLGAMSTLAVPAPGQDVIHEVGQPRRNYGERSGFERAGRYFNPGAYGGTGAARTPLQDLYGIITPSALFFERLHAGVPSIDPTQHQLLIDGLVETPLIFSMKDLERMPSVSRVHFVECAGNSGSEHAGEPRETPQKSHGLVSCAEWTGVPLSTLLNNVGVKPRAKWLYAEGADACRLARSIPLEKAMDDIIVAYGQNGEALRPEQGYPLRLVVPGWEGNINIKWLQRLALVDEPAMTKDEAASYTDLQPNGKARQFTFVMEAKSVITRPAGGHVLDVRGAYEISGLAWSGRGRVQRVQVSANSGRDWKDAELQKPILTKALTRFRLPWKWDGQETTIASRCQDETGYWQPTRDEIVSVRGLTAGPDGYDHYNGIKWWRVKRSGEITYA